MNKKTLLILSLIIILMSFGITYSWLSWSSSNTSVTFNIEGITITYNSGSTITGNLIPTSSRTVSGNIAKTITVQSNTTVEAFNLYLDLVTFPAELSEESLVWEIYKNGNLVNSGNFFNEIEGNSIVLLNTYATTSEDTYILYIWIDGNQSNPNTMQNKTFSFNLNADASTNPVTSSILDYKIYGNSVQNGTPTPTSPVAIESLGSYNSVTGKYDIEVTARGKNIIDKSLSTISGIKNESSFTAWASVAFTNTWILNNLLPDTEYTISYDVECISLPVYTQTYSSNVGFFIYSGVTGYNNVMLYNNEYLTAGSNKHYSFTFTTPPALHEAAANYRIFAYTNRYLNGSTGVFSTMKFSNIQLELGISSTNYEPYYEPVTYTIPLAEPLRCINEICDYIDYENKKVVRNVGIKKYIGDSTVNWYYVQNSDASWGSFYTNNGYLPNANVNNINETILSTHYPYLKSSVSSYRNRSILGIMGYSDSSAAFMITSPTSIANSAATYKTWLATQNTEGNPLIIQYLLASSTRESITLPVIPKFNGTDTTILSVSDGNIEASSVTGSFYKS